MREKIVLDMQAVTVARVAGADQKDYLDYMRRMGEEAK